MSGEPTVRHSCIDLKGFDILTLILLVKLLDASRILLAFYCPNLQRGSKGKDGKLAVSSELGPEAIDLVIVGFILAMHDADKLFGHLGDDVSPRPGFGGATCEYTSQERFADMS